jgi:hypothetical protein
MTEVQGNREFMIIVDGSGSEYAYIYKVDGEHYDGKGYQYHRCPICRKFVCPMMDGSRRHYVACKRQNP